MKQIKSSFLIQAFSILINNIYTLIISQTLNVVDIFTLILIIMLIVMKIFMKWKIAQFVQYKQGINFLFQVLLVAIGIMQKNLPNYKYFLIGLILQSSLKNKRYQNYIKFIENLLIIIIIIFYIIIQFSQQDKYDQNIIQTIFMSTTLIFMLVYAIISFQQGVNTHNTIQSPTKKDIKNFKQQDQVENNEQSNLKEKIKIPDSNSINHSPHSNMLSYRYHDNAKPPLTQIEQQPKNIQLNQTSTSVFKRYSNSTKPNENQLDFMSKILNSFPDGIILITQEKKLVFINNSLKRMTNSSSKKEAFDKLLFLKNSSTLLEEQDKYSQLLKFNSNRFNFHDDFNPQRSYYEGSQFDDQEDQDQDLNDFETNLYQNFSKLNSVKAQLDILLKGLLDKEEQIIRQQFDDDQELNFHEEIKMICEGNEAISGNSDVRSATVTSSKVQKKPLFQVTFKPFLKNGKGFVLMVMRDVTFFNQIVVLQAINRNKSKMLSQVAHEFRTPLNCIILMIKSLVQYSDEGILKKYLDPTIASAEQLLSLVNDLLDAAMLKAGKFKLSHISFDLYKLIENVQQIMEVQTNAKKIGLVVQICKGTSRQIISDCNRIRQILINLISNAVKFTFKGSIQLIIKNISPELLEFNVIDSGTGISKNNQSKLFDAFAKLEDPNNYNQQGVGLGLMISNILAQKLSNSNQGLSVQSEGEGKGSKFIFYVYDHGKGNIQEFKEDESQGSNMDQRQIEKNCSIRSNRSNSLNKQSVTRKYQNDYKQEELFRVQKILFQHPNITFNRKLTDSFKGLSDIENTLQGGSHPLIQTENRVYENQYLFSPNCQCYEILLVDDIPFNLMALVAILERYKLKIDTAYSGMEALHKIQNFKKCSNCDCRNFRIVMIDIEMPGMNGIETTVKILEYADQQNLTIWVFGNSGHGEDSEKAKCLKVGMSGYFIKPIDVEVFLNLLIELNKPSKEKE